MKTIQDFLRLLVAANNELPKCFQCSDHTRIKEVALIWNSNDVSALNYSLIQRHKENGLRYLEGKEGHDYPVLFVYVENNAVSNIFSKREDVSRYKIQLSVADQYIADKENQYDIRTKHEIYFDTEAILLKVLHLVGLSSFDETNNEYVFNDINEIGSKIFKSNKGELIINPIELGSQHLIGASTWLDIPMNYCIEMNCPDE